MKLTLTDDNYEAAATVMNLTSELAEHLADKIALALGLAYAFGQEHPGEGNPYMTIVEETDGDD